MAQQITIWTAVDTIIEDVAAAPLATVAIDAQLDVNLRGAFANWLGIDSFDVRSLSSAIVVRGIHGQHGYSDLAVYTMWQADGSGAYRVAADPRPVR